MYICVALLSSYLCQPRQGHLEAVFYLSGYLKAHDRSTMVFDSKYVPWGDKDFPTHDWTDFYQVTEDIPSNAPEPRGMPVRINAFVDASHALILGFSLFKYCAYHLVLEGTKDSGNLLFGG